MPSEISEVMKQLRDQRGLKQKEIAERLNLSQKTYSRYENGDREPDIETMITIANFFNVPLDILVGRYTVNKKFDNKDQ